MSAHVLPRLVPLALLAVWAVAAPRSAAQHHHGDDGWTPETYRVAAPPPAGFDRAEAAATALRLLTDLIAVDTRNPPGNEGAAAAVLAEAFEAAGGFEVHVLEVGDDGEGGVDRANLVARLRAPAPTAPPVLVLGHLDTVGWVDRLWDSDPNVATLADGYLHGRGAIDCKGPLSMEAAAVLQLARQRERLTRDVVFLATAAEEGGPDVGVDRVLERHRELIGEPEFALNEGGRVRVQDGRVHSVNIQTTEKVAYDVAVRALGPSGHGSVPLPDNALAALARALGRVHEHRFPASLNETTRLFFARLATIEGDGRRREAMRTVGGAALGRVTDPEVAAAVDVLDDDPLFNAVLRTGASLTMVDGGFRSNVIPSGGTANFNTRILPEDDIGEIVAAMQAAGGEPQVSFTLDGEPRTPPPTSSVETALYRAMESAARVMAPDAVVMPFMSTGATDGSALRRAGIATYGILPAPLVMVDELRMHGDNERIPVPSLGWGAEYIYRTLAGVCLDG